MAKHYEGQTVHEKQFIKTFDTLTQRHNPWTVWCDFVNMTACSISNAVDREQDRWKEREESYLASVKGYQKEELEVFPKLLTITVDALSANPAQDFLGNLYMNLDFGRAWHGQFFTPYNISEMMVRMIVGSGTEKVKNKGFFSIHDCCCGAGCMLIAAANAYQMQKLGNYQQDILFVGQDIDQVVAQMCYIQLSLLGCAGYVVVGDVFQHPILGYGLVPTVDSVCGIWFTPMWFFPTWEIRRALAYFRKQ